MDIGNELLRWDVREILVEFPIDELVDPRRGKPVFDRQCVEKEQGSVQGDGHLRCLHTVDLDEGLQVLLEFLRSIGILPGVCIVKGKSVLPLVDGQQDPGCAAAFDLDGLHSVPADAEP